MEILSSVQSNFEVSSYLIELLTFQQINNENFNDMNAFFSEKNLCLSVKRYAPLMYDTCANISGGVFLKGFNLV